MLMSHLVTRAKDRLARPVLALTAAALLGYSPVAVAQSGVWTNTAGGDYATGSNWAGGTVASGAGNTADFSTLDLPTDVSVTVASDLTLGALLFGDTDNPGSPSSWELRTDSTTVLTLNNNGASPTITVNPLGPTGLGFDDAFIGLQLAGTDGLTKAGDGVLTIGNDATALTGPININGGTLRISDSGVLAGAGTAPITLADGATIESRIGSGVIRDVTLAPGATGTVRMEGSGSNFLNTIQGSGTSTLNLEFGTSGATYSGEGDWATGGGHAVVNMTGTSELGVSSFRGRINRPAPNNWSSNAFENSVVNLDNVEFYVQTNSFGNNVPFGALNGTASAILRGGNGGSGGSAVRYIIGGANTDSTFAGEVNGAGNTTAGPFGGMSIDKVGTGTHTFTGTFTNSLVGSNSDIGRQGGVIRVSEGTLAFAGATTSVPGGFGTLKSTIDVLPGAVLDVSGTDTTFQSSPLQQIQGSGTIVGPFNHAAGEIRPADVSTADNDTTLTNLPVPTVGTIDFTGDLAFNGGTIVYDMNETPGVNDLIQVNGTTSVAGGGMIDPNFLGADPAAGQTYTFLTSSGGFSDSVAGWTVNWPGRGTKPSVFIDGNDLKFTTTEVGAGGAVLWTGATNGVWDVESTQNWSLGGSADTFFQGDDVTFDNSGSNTAINVTTIVNPRNVVVDSNGSYGFSGSSIVASGSLTKRGTGTLTLATENEFTSATIEGGTVDMSDANGTLGTGLLTLSGATLTNVPASGDAFKNSGIAVSAGTTNAIEINGSGGTARPSIPTLSGDGTLNITLNADDSWMNLGGTTGFTGELTIGPDGVSATTLGNVRTSGAATSMPEAKVTLNSLTLANQNGGSGEIVMAFGELDTDAGAILSGFVGGSGTIPAVLWEIGGLDGDSEVAGAIIDGGGGGGSVAVSSVRKIGSGSLVLSGANTYTGDTKVAEGVLSVTSPMLDDNSTVIVDAGAILDLDHSIEDVVATAYYDNVALAPGVYGAAGSGAANIVSWITGGGRLNVASLGTLLPGDFNDDGSVDAADYVVWRNNLGAGAGTLANDTVGGPIDADQLALWKSNYGATAGSLATAVPEPSTLVGGLLILGLTATRRRRARGLANPVSPSLHCSSPRTAS